MHGTTRQDASKLLGELILVSVHDGHLICVSDGSMLSLGKQPSSDSALRNFWHLVLAALVCVTFVFYVLHHSEPAHVAPVAELEEPVNFPTYTQPAAVANEAASPVPNSAPAGATSPTSKPSPIEIEQSKSVPTVIQRPLVTKHLTVTVDGEDYKVDWHNDANPTNVEIRHIQAEIRASRDRGEQQGTMLIQP
jgi:hypothetical protein